MIWYLASDRTMTSTKGHQNMRTFCSVTISHPLRHPVDTSLRLHSLSWPLVWTRFELPSLFMSESYYPCAILCCKFSHSASLYFSGFSVFFWFLCVCVHALLLVCFSTVHCYIYTLTSIHPHIKFIYFCAWFQHGIDSDQPYPYSHLDIAGSSGPFPGIPTGSPILAFAAQYVLPRLPWKAADMD